MKLSQEETFGSVMDYFAGRQMRILTSNSPSFIRAEFGTWLTIALDNTIGEVTVNIVKRNGGSYVNLNFNFTKHYIFELIAGIIGAIGLYLGLVFISSINLPNIPPILRDNYTDAMNMLIVLGIVFLCGLLMGVGAYSASRTRKRFLSEFNTFMQSLGQMKD